MFTSYICYFPLNYVSKHRNFCNTCVLRNNKTFYRNNHWGNAHYKLKKQVIQGKFVSSKILLFYLSKFDSHAVCYQNFVVHCVRLCKYPFFLKINNITVIKLIPLYPQSINMNVRIKVGKRISGHCFAAYIL